MGTRRAKGKGLELRTRTGCNRCRQRRVKCPEQKPACQPCQNFGFACSYEKTLKWQRVKSCDSDFSPLQHIEKWMFLHASYSDFDASPSLQLLPEAGLDDSQSSDSDEDVEPAVWAGMMPDPGALSTDNGYIITLPPSLSPLRLTPVESHLWTYFHRTIAPACVLDPSLNPYQDVILKIAASTGNSSPLFHTIMAISASQLYILGHRDYHSSSWAYRYQALRSLRLETAKLEQEMLDQSSEAQILATVMTLVFLDILSDCSASWVVHANFARSLIYKLRNYHMPLGQDIEALLNFVGGYIVVHEVYAHTAWNATIDDVRGGPVTTMCDDSNLQTLTGCSTEFFQILADINTLASDYSRCSGLDFADPDMLSSLEYRRHHLERQLHGYTPACPIDEPGVDVPETILVTETKRLTGLLHLYSRVDHLGPCDPCISKLSSQILGLIRRIPARSNTILWPLFMVATLGIAPECEEDRVFVLEKLDLLERARQMRYIKKAKRIIVGVWKMRDLKDAETRRGWDILQQVGQLERISLF